MTTVPRVCSVDDCGRKAHAGRMCQTHYNRLKSGKPLDTPVRTYGNTGSCSVEGCDKPFSCRGLCDGHYQRLSNGKRVNTPLGERNQVGCKVEGCDKPHSSKGLCRAHHFRQRTYGLTVEQAVDYFERPCAICGSREKTHIDHDHECCPGRGSCGECVRGTLCSSCNLGLGAFRDDVDKLRKAIEYLTATNDVVLLAM